MSSVLNFLVACAFIGVVIVLVTQIFKDFDEDWQKEFSDV